MATSGAAVVDGKRWALRALGVLAIPWLILTSQALGSDEPPWVATLPALFVAVVVAIAFVIGALRGRKMRALAADLGWQFEPHVFPPGALVSALFPFDDRNRSPGDGCVGVWLGQTGAVFTHGARTTVTARSMLREVPTLQLVPKGALALLDTGGGRRLNAESAVLQGRWQVVAADERIAHAMLPPHSLAALEDFGAESTNVAFDRGLAWTTDTGVRLTADDVRKRLDLLSRLTEQIPLSVTVEESSRPSAFFRGTREKNILGRLSVLLPFTIFGAPFGLWLGFRALRAVREGRADNRRTAVWGVALSIAAMALCVWWAFELVQEALATP
jgi:hypothetical protein